MCSLVQKLEITRNFCQFANESKQPFAPFLKEAIEFGYEYTKGPRSIQNVDSTLISDFTSQLNNFEHIVGNIRKKVQTSCFKDFKMYYCCDNYDELSAMLELNISLSKIEVLYLCLVLLQVPKCFGLLQIFCARSKIHLQIMAITNTFCQTKR